MSADFLHGVETTEILTGPRPIKQVKSAVIGLIGTAPIHHATTPPAIDKPILVLSDRDAPQFGPDIAGYSIPSALTAIFDQGVGTVIVINTFDPTTNKTTTAPALEAIAAKKIDLGATDLISVTVTKADDTACVEGVDYTVDRVTGIVTILDGGNLAAEVQAKAGWDKANPAAVLAADIIGTVDAGGVRSGAQAFLDAASTIGFGPKVLIAPGFSGDETVRAALQVLAQKSKLRAVVLADVPVGTTRDQAIAGRASNVDVDLTTSDERVFYCYPYVKKTKDLLEPYSQRFAGAIAATDNEVGYWKSPSNRVILGIVGVEVPLTAQINDPNSDVNALNAAGIGTVFAGSGTGLRTWGNRSSAFPGSSDITSFLSVRRTIDVVDESVELATLRYLDGPVGDVLIKAVLDDVNAFLRTLITRGALVPGSRIEYFAADNPADQLALGKITFTKTMCPPPPAERITYKSVVDTTLLGS